MVGLIGVLVTNCGGGGACSDSPIVGSWTNEAGSQTLTFNGACGYSDNSCGHVGTYPAITSNSGNVDITITAVATSAPAGCLTTGTHNCEYEIAESGGDTALGIFCGGSELVYVKD